jgi:Escherichia/Staphylococcus phage prohead protease
MTDQFLAALERKTVTDAGAGEIEGLATTYGNVDLQDDEMQPGAMDRTVEHWQRSRSRLPLLDWHGDSLSKLIGSVTALKSVAQGLWFRAGFGSDPESQRARQLVKDGHLSGVSIGYLPVRQSYKQVGDKNVRALHEVKLLEISLTPVPANPQAQLTSVKSFGRDAARYDDDVAELERLEAWASRELAVSALTGLTSDPDTMLHIGGVLAHQKTASDLRKLEAWAMAQPPGPSERELEAARWEERWEENNRRSSGMRDWFANANATRRCGSCWHCSIGGACEHYR